MVATSTQENFTISSGTWHKCFPNGRLANAPGGQIIWPLANGANLYLVLVPAGSTAPTVDVIQ